MAAMSLCASVLVGFVWEFWPGGAGRGATATSHASAAIQAAPAAAPPAAVEREPIRPVGHDAAGVPDEAATTSR
jgi:hypothetical protein